MLALIQVSIRHAISRRGKPKALSGYFESLGNPDLACDVNQIFC
jgi:hypothetical protein